MAINYGETTFELGVPYPIFFRPINTGKILPDWGELFVLDLATLDYCGKERLNIDYNHDPDQVIGYIDTNTFKIDSTGWIGDGFLLSLQEGDRASDVIQRGKAGTPWEVSPTLDMNEDNSTKIKPGEAVTINGMELTGPFTIYHNVPVRGISVCPYGRDNETSALLGFNFIKKGKLKMSTKTTNLSDEDKDKKEELSEEDKTKEELSEDDEKVKDDVLAKFTKRFGAEQGVKLYQQNLDYDEIDQAFQLLQKCGITSLSDEEPKEEPKPAEEPAPTDDPDSKEELKKLRAEINHLKKQTRGLTEPIGKNLSHKNDETEKVVDQIRNKYLGRKKS